MSEVEQLKAKWNEAVARKQYDIAEGYFQALLEAGAKDMDSIKPGSGDVWRDIGRACAALTSASVREK